MVDVSLFPKCLFVTLATIASSLGALCWGMNTGWTSPSLIKLQAEDSPVPITSDQGSWIVVALYFGIIIGSVLWNMLMNRISKRIIAMISLVPFVISWWIIAFAQSFYLLLVARIIAGIGNALLFCSVSLFLGEMSNSERRGLVLTFIPLSVAVGSLLVNILGSYASIRTTALLSSLVPTLSLGIFVLVPDSPYDLIQQDRLEDAKKSLMKYRGVDDVEEDFNRIKDAIEEQAAISGGCYADLIVVPNYRKSLFTLLGVRAIFDLSGTAAINAYSQTIFLQVNGDSFALILSSIYFLTSIVFLIVSLVLIDLVGRRLLMLSATTTIAISLVTLTTVCYLNEGNLIDRRAFVYASTGSLLVYTAANSLGMRSIATIFLSEMFPSSLKSYASNVLIIYFCFSSTIITKVFQITGDKFGMQVPFLIFTICTFFGVPFIIYFVPETKGKNLEEIQRLLNNKK